MVPAWELVALAVAILLAALPPGASHVRPHVVFIIADDLGWSDVGFHSGDVFTPNLDALALHGVLLGRHYAQPLCTPSRAALLTADYPIRHGMQGEPCLAGVADGLPTNLKLMPQYFRELGYKTHLVGKWHLGYQTWDHLPTRRGFDTFFGYLNGYLGYWDASHFFGGKVGRDIRRNEDGAWSEVYGRYLTEVLTEEAVTLIGSHNKNKSMLLFLNHNAVHTTPLGMEREAPTSVANLTGRGILREMVRWLDKSVGEVVSALEKNNMLNNTILIFISDNGAPSHSRMFENYGSNWPFRGQKASCHEGGVRTPAFIYSNLLPPRPSQRNQLFHITDWLPTLYSAVGGDIKNLKSQDGVDQWLSLLTGVEGPRTELLVDMDEEADVEAYISGKWKLIKNNDPDNKGAIDDLYTGVSPEWMDYDWAAVGNSSAGAVLGGLPEGWRRQWEAARVRGGCAGDPAAAARHDCHTRHCLFDLDADPSECEDLAAGRPDLAAELLARLDHYRAALVPQRPRLHDIRARPELHDDYWGPWLESDEGQ